MSSKSKSNPNPDKKPEKKKLKIEKSDESSSSSSSSSQFKETLAKFEKTGFIQVIKVPSLQIHYDDNDADEDELIDEDDNFESEIIVEEYIEEKPQYAQIINKDIKYKSLDKFLEGVDASKNSIIPCMKRNKLAAVWNSVKSNCFNDLEFSQMSKQNQNDFAWDQFEKKFPSSNPGIFHVSSWRVFKTTFTLRNQLTLTQIRLILASSHPTCLSPEKLIQIPNRQLSCQEIGTVAEEYMRVATEKILNCEIFKPECAFVSEDGLFVTRIDGLIKKDNEITLWECKHIVPFRKFQTVKQAIESLSACGKQSCCLHLINGKIVLNQNHLYGHQILLMMYILKLNKCKLSVALKGFDFKNPSTHHRIEIINIEIEPENLEMWYQNEASLAREMIKTGILKPLINREINDHGQFTEDCPDVDCRHCFCKVPAADWNLHVQEKHTKCELCPSLKFMCIDRLNMHRFKAHQALPKFKCEHCPKRFSALQILTQHHDRRHRDTLFSCGKCTLKFSSFWFYDQHNRVEHLNKPLHKPKKEDCCLNPLCDLFEILVPRGNVLRHVQTPGQKYDACRTAWTAAGNDPVIAQAYQRGGGPKSKEDEEEAVWICPGRCESEATNSKRPEGQKMLWPKKSLIIHWQGQARMVNRDGSQRSHKTPPCPFYAEWKLDNPDDHWDGTVWRCSCGEYFPACEEDEIYTHTEDCDEFKAFERGDEEAEIPIQLPTFKYKPQGPKKNKKKVVEEEEEDEEDEQ